MATSGKKPISPKAHGAIDCGSRAANLLAPSLPGLKGPAGALYYLLGGTQGALDAFADQPPALKRLVPFRTPGTVGLSSGPHLVLLSSLGGR